MTVIQTGDNILTPKDLSGNYKCAATNSLDEYVPVDENDTTEVVEARINAVQGECSRRTGGSMCNPNECGVALLKERMGLN